MALYNAYGRDLMFDELAANPPVVTNYAPNGLSAAQQAAHILFNLGLNASKTTTLTAGTVVANQVMVAGASSQLINMGSLTFLSTAFLNLSAADNVSAAGNSQGTATALTAQVNNIGTVTAGQGVNLPTSTPGLQVTIVNNGANPLQVYPKQGSADTINSLAATVGVSILPGAIGNFNCTLAGAWWAQADTVSHAAYNTNAATSGTTLTAANITGGDEFVMLNMTGALGAGANAQLPTVSALLAAMHCATKGASYHLRIANTSSGNFAWTITTNTGWTLNGTMTIAQNTFREFVVTITSTATATATLQSLGTSIQNAI